LTVVLLAQLPADCQFGHCATAIFQPLHGGQIRPVRGIRRESPPKLGDSRTFWLMDMGIMPPGQSRCQATCRGVGNHCYLFVEDSSWNAGQMDSTDVAFILERFDHRSPRDSTKGVWQHNTGSFGMPPDVDHDSLVYIMYYDVGSFHGYTFDGFWMYFDEYPDSIAYPMWGYHSNECEVVYIDDYPGNPGTDYRVAIVAHEFEHMIHYNYDPVESLWVNEGCAELAMWLYGSPDVISGFNSQPDNDLIIWDGQWADYIQTYLFFLYLYEQYGERTGQPLIKRIVANPGPSVDGIDRTFVELGLSQRFKDVFNDWVIANYLDDTLACGGRYGYYGERLPVFYTVNLSSYPVNNPGTLKRWAGKYFRFSQGNNITLGFDGEDGAQFKANVVARDTINRVFVVDSILLDSVQAGSVNIPGFGTTYQYVYLMPANNTPDGIQNAFRYTATVTGIEETPDPPLPSHSDLRAVRADRNLLTASYLSKTDGMVHLDLFSASGRQIGQTEARVNRGLNLLTLDISRVPAGAYFLAARAGDHQAIAKVGVVRQR
jgi:hypothetical protein